MHRRTSRRVVWDLGMPHWMCYQLRAEQEVYYKLEIGMICNQGTCLTTQYGNAYYISLHCLPHAMVQEHQHPGQIGLEHILHSSMTIWLRV